MNREEKRAPTECVVVTFIVTKLSRIPVSVNPYGQPQYTRKKRDSETRNGLPKVADQVVRTMPRTRPTDYRFGVLEKGRLTPNIPQWSHFISGLWS